MPHSESDLVDYAASKNLEKLEAAFGDLMALRTASYVDSIQDYVGAEFSSTGEDE